MKGLELIVKASDSVNKATKSLFYSSVGHTVAGFVDEPIVYGAAITSSLAVSVYQIAAMISSMPYEEVERVKDLLKGSRIENSGEYDSNKKTHLAKQNDVIDKNFF